MSLAQSGKSIMLKWFVFLAAPMIPMLVWAQGLERGNVGWSEIATPASNRQLRKRPVSCADKRFGSDIRLVHTDADT